MQRLLTFEMEETTDAEGNDISTAALPQRKQLPVLNQITSGFNLKPVSDADKVHRDVLPDSKKHERENFKFTGNDLWLNRQGNKHGPYNVTVKKFIAKGSFGTVWDCDIKSNSTKKSKYVFSNVVIKQPIDQPNKDNKFTQLAEGVVMRVAGCYYVVTCYGYIYKYIQKTQERLDILILENCELGCLSPLLKEKKVPVKLVNNMIIDVAEGLKYLSEMNIVHGDLATRNIMVTKHFTAKIGDFGRATIVKRNQDKLVNSEEDSRPERWLPPETLIRNIYSMKTDVWSFGILLFEIIYFELDRLCGKIPYAEFHMMHDDRCEKFIKHLFYGCPLKLLEKQMNQKNLEKETQNVLKCAQLCLQWVPPPKREKEIIKEVEKEIVDCIDKNLANRPTAMDVLQNVREHIPYYNVDIDQDNLLSDVNIYSSELPYDENPDLFYR